MAFTTSTHTSVHVEDTESVILGAKHFPATEERRSEFYVLELSTSKLGFNLAIHLSASQLAGVRAQLAKLEEDIDNVLPDDHASDAMAYVSVDDFTASDYAFDSNRERGL